MKRCTQPYVESVLNWQATSGEVEWRGGRSPIGCIITSRRMRSMGVRCCGLMESGGDFEEVGFQSGDRHRRGIAKGCGEWTGNKPGLRDDVARYFIERSRTGRCCWEKRRWFEEGRVIEGRL